METDEKPKLEALDIFRIVIAFGIFVVWVGWNLADALSKSVEANLTIQAPMMLVAGWLFGGPIFKKDDKEKSG